MYTIFRPACHEISRARLTTTDEDETQAAASTQAGLPRQTPGVCFQFQRKGACERGDGCKFSHDLSLSAVDSGRNPPKPNRKQKGKQKQYVRQLYGKHVDPADCENGWFDAFYDAQRIVPDGEWPEFAASLRSSLPLSVRLNRFKVWCGARVCGAPYTRTERIVPFQ